MRLCFLNLNLYDDNSMGSTIEKYLEMVLIRRYTYPYIYKDTSIDLDIRVLHVRYY